MAREPLPRDKRDDGCTPVLVGALLAVLVAVAVPLASLVALLGRS